MSTPEWQVRVSPSLTVSVSPGTGDIHAVTAAGAEGRLLLAGLGPLRSADGGGWTLLLDAESGERWLIRISAASGLVCSVETAPDTGGRIPCSEAI